VLESVLGWSGVILYLLAHGRISVLKHKADREYYLMNLIAAVLVVVSSLIISSWQPVIINTFWALVSLAAVCRFRLPSLFLDNRVLALLVGLMFVAGTLYIVMIGKIGFSILAWSSVIAFCFSYWLFSCRQLSQKGYFLFSMYAAYILLPQLYLDTNWPVFVMELVWGSLSVIGFYRLRNSPSMKKSQII